MTVKNEEKTDSAGLAEGGNDTTVVPAPQLSHDADRVQLHIARLKMSSDFWLRADPEFSAMLRARRDHNPVAQAREQLNARIREAQPIADWGHIEPAIDAFIAAVETQGKADTRLAIAAAENLTASMAKQANAANSRNKVLLVNTATLIAEQRQRAESALQAAQDEITTLKAARDEYLALASVGAWHNDCRPNRQKAASEIAKGQEVINRLADTISQQAQSLARLRDALKRFGRHSQQCRGDRGVYGDGCTCGLDAVLTDTDPPDQPVHPRREIV